MKLALVLLVACCAVIVAGQGTKNTPSTYNKDGNHLSTGNPCEDIIVQNWADVASTRITTDPNFDESIPADYASIYNGDDNLYKFPNGFRKGQVYEDNNPPFCFRVPNVGNRQVQVMIQTVDDQARLCIKDTTTTGVANGGTIDRCFSDKTIACFGGLTYSTSLTLVVYLDSTGSTTATSFWYRVRVSTVQWSLTNSADKANSAVASLESWCLEQDQELESMRFPKELRSTIVPELAALTVDGAANMQTAPIVTILMLAIAAIMAIGRQ